MAKRFLKIFIILLLILVVVLFGFSLFNKNNNTQNPQTPNEDSSGTNFVSDFFNTIKNIGGEGDNNPDNTENTDISNEEDTTGTNVSNLERNRLYKVSSMPVAGYTVFSKEQFKEITESETTGENTKPTAPGTELVDTLRYVDSANGYVYQNVVNEGVERKLSQTMIPAVKEAFFGNNGSSVIMRYLKEDGETIETFTGSLPKEILGGDSPSGTEVTGSFLPEDIKELAISSDTSKIFFMYNVKDIMAGITSLFLGTNKDQVFDSPFTEWLPQWPTENLITITTKPSSRVPGYMYTINPSKKDLNKVLSGINGLTTLTSPDGKMVLYNNNLLKLSLFNLETRESTPIKINTLTEKCVWNYDSTAFYCAVPKFTDNSSGYPDSWYQGVVSFADSFWKTTVSDNESKLILEPTSFEGVGELDAIKMMVDKKEKNIFFVNKTDSFLWSISLK